MIKQFFRDPVSGFTHLFGMLISIVALVILVRDAAQNSTVWHVVSFSIFGASLILLYAASSLYHLLPVSPQVMIKLRKVDHMMIFVLIAGTYTPVCLVPLRGPWGWSLLSAIWTIAIAGMVMKMFWLQAPRWLSTGIYLLMGWMIIVAVFPLTHSLPLDGFAWLAAGGLLYTLGAVIYGAKWPKINLPWFGFHEIFHLFVLAGSFAHFWLMFKYIMVIG